MVGFSPAGNSQALLLLSVAFTLSSKLTSLLSVAGETVLLFRVFSSLGLKDTVYAHGESLVKLFQSVHSHPTLWPSFFWSVLCPCTVYSTAFLLPAMWILSHANRFPQLFRTLTFKVCLRNVRGLHIFQNWCKICLELHKKTGRVAAAVVVGVCVCVCIAFL